MKGTTYNIIKATLDGDDTLSEVDRKAILASCRDPVPRPILIDPQPGSERYLRPREAASALGVSPRTVQRWVRAGTLDSRKVVGCRRIPWSAVRRLCDGDRRAPESRLPESTVTADFDGKDEMAAG